MAGQWTTGCVNFRPDWQLCESRPEQPAVFELAAGFLGCPARSAALGTDLMWRFHAARGDPAQPPWLGRFRLSLGKTALFAIGVTNGALLSLPFRTEEDCTSEPGKE